MHPYLASLLGGVLIGLSAWGLLRWHGRIAGISGIAGGLLAAQPEDRRWRLSFLGGLLVAGIAGAAIAPQAFATQHTLHWTVLAVAGLLVGFGTRLGNGCTSGHGICGLSRLSLRSLVATLTFIVTAMVTVFVVRHGGL